MQDNNYKYFFLFLRYIFVFYPREQNTILWYEIEYFNLNVQKVLFQT